MKLQLFKAFFTASVVAFGVTNTINQASQAQGTTFYCGVSAGIPSTLANTPRGTVVVIRWVSQYFTGGGYNPQRRCQEVSSRFQRHYNQGNLNFITAGYLNNQPAICAGDGGIPCTSQKLLFTLKPGQNAARTIQQLFNVRTGAAGPLYESTNASKSSKSVVDMNKFLQTAEIVNANSPVKTPPTTKNPSVNTPVKPPSNGNSAW